MVKGVNAIFRGNETVDSTLRGLRGKGGLLFVLKAFCHVTDTHKHST